MAVGRVARNLFLELSDGTTSTDISTFVTEARLITGRDAVEETAMGDDSHTFLPGLRNDSIAVTMKMGYGSGSPEAVIASAMLAASEVKIEMRPDRDLAVSVNNPRYRLEGAIFTGTDFSPVGGRIGELQTSPMTISPVSGQKWVRTIV